MRYPRVALLLVLPLGLVAPASPQGMDMSVAKKALLVDGGSRARLEVTASCPAGTALLESFVYVNQNGSSSERGSVSVPCDGLQHARTVEVSTLGFVLQSGRAVASGYMLVTTGDSISPVFPLKLKAARP